MSSPVDKIISLKKGTKAKKVHYSRCIAFLTCESGPLKAVYVLPNSIAITWKGKKKAEPVGIADQLKVRSVGTVQAIKSCIEGHLKKIEQKYEGLCQI